MKTNCRERVLDALLLCPTQKEAAEAAGVTDRTVRKYLADDVFKAEYDERRRALVSETAGALQKNMGEAVETLADAMRNASKPLERMTAAKAVLDYGIKYTELSDLYARLETMIKLAQGERQ